MKRDFALILPNEATGEHEVMTITLFDNPTEADMATRAIYGSTAYAIESSMWDLKVPCIYKDGAFYNVQEEEKKDEAGEIKLVRVGEKLAERIPSQAEEIQELKKQNEELRQTVNSLVLDSLGGD